MSTKNLGTTEDFAALPTYASKRLALQRAPHTIALLGDSITANNVQVSGAFTFNAGRGFWTWADMRLRHRLSLVARSGTFTGGVSGETTGDILARVQQDAVALAPGLCAYLGGTNDMKTGVAIATSKANALATWDALDAAGIPVVAGTILPLGGATTAQKNWTVQWNRWLKSLAFSRRNFLVADYFGALAASDGSWLVPGSTNTRYTADDTHPSTGGAARMGKVLSDLLDPLIGEVDSLATSNLDGSGSGADIPNIAANPMLSGTGGTLTTGITGQVADSWTAASSSGATLSHSVASKVARTDQLPGVWQQLSVSSSVEDPRLIYEVSSGNWQVGDVIYAECELQSDSDWSSINYARLVASCVSSGFSNLAVAYGHETPAPDITTNYPYENRPNNVVVVTPQITIPTNTTHVYLMFEFKGIGTVRFTRMALRRIR